MSRLDDLLTSLCPDGVEYKTLEYFLKIKNGSDYKGFSKGEFPVYGSGGIMTYIDRFAYDKPSVLIPRKGSIDKLYYVEVPFWNVDTIFYTEINTEKANPRYVYHCLLKEHLEQYNTAGGVPSLTQKVLNKVRIPLPPLEVQQEIVRILDSFTALTAELQAELQARKKQYEYYRNELLHLDGEKIAIQDLFDTRNGFTPSKDNPEFWENGNLPWFRIDDINDKGRVLSDSYLHITPKALKKSGLFPGNSIIISTSATIGEYALITVPFLCNQRFTCLTVKPKYRDCVNNKFLMHYCPILSKFCKEHLNQGNFASVDMKQFMKFEFVIPSLEKQNQIVSILDRFDSLCNDISIGLPAEIEARQKQYEYYRDKLLTFKEK